MSNSLSAMNNYAFLTALIVLLALAIACAEPAGDAVQSPVLPVVELATQPPIPTVPPIAVPTPTPTQTPEPTTTPARSPMPSPTPTPTQSDDVTRNRATTDSWVKVEYQGVDHVIPGEEHDRYNSAPATSGWHFGAPVAPARWGIHTIPLPDEVLVHNLEHGYVNVHYNCPDGCDALVTQLSEVVDFATDVGAKVLMSPYPDMATRIALTAWTVIDKFDDFDDVRIIAFIMAHESSPLAPEANVPR